MAAGDTDITVVENATGTTVAAAAKALWTAATDTFNYVKDGTRVWVIRQLNA